jgi:hypothetical protein
MPMLPYPLVCYWPGCGRAALYKIAGRWSDGLTEELKTWSLCCESCLAELYLRAKRKQAACLLAPGESLDVPGIYELARGRRDNQLVRRFDLEEQLSRPELPPPSS